MKKQLGQSHHVLDFNTHDCIRALYLSKFIVDAEILANKLNFIAVVEKGEELDEEGK